MRGSWSHTQADARPALRWPVEGWMAGVRKGQEVESVGEMIHWDAPRDEVRLEDSGWAPQATVRKD